MGHLPMCERTFDCHLVLTLFSAPPMQGTKEVMDKYGNAAEKMPEDVAQLAGTERCVCGGAGWLAGWLALCVKIQVHFPAGPAVARSLGAGRGGAFF